MIGLLAGGLLPDDVTQSWRRIPAIATWLIAEYHDPDPFAMT